MMDDSLRGSLRNLNRNNVRDTNNKTYPIVQENAGNFFNQNTHSDMDRRTTALTYTHDSGQGPAFKQFSITSTRLSSFKTWPTSIQQTPETMTEAGFYFTGNNVTVICFYCGIVLQFLNSEDDPLIEHARWSPECQFLKDKKGLNFIASVQDDIKKEWLRRDKIKSLCINQVEASTHNCFPLNLGSHNSVSNGDGYARSEYRITDVLPSGKPPTKAEKQNPLFTDAAQSILTMGYLPKVIKIVVDRVLEEKGWNGMSEKNLMVEIKKIEESGEISKLTIPVSSSKKCISKDDFKKIADENKEMKDKMQCNICCEIPLTTVFLPCRHLLACSKCADTFTTCPVCRSKIKGSVKVQFKK